MSDALKTAKYNFPDIPHISDIMFTKAIYSQGSHRNLKTQFHDFSMIKIVISMTI